jgi:hypothetical protein
MRPIELLPDSPFSDRDIGWVRRSPLLRGGLCGDFFAIRGRGETDARMNWETSLLCNDVTYEPPFSRGRASAARSRVVVPSGGEGIVLGILPIARAVSCLSSWVRNEGSLVERKKSPRLFEARGLLCAKLTRMVPLVCIPETTDVILRRTMDGSAMWKFSVCRCSWLHQCNNGAKTVLCKINIHEFTC